MTALLTVLLLMMQGVSSLDFILLIMVSESKFLSSAVQNFPKFGTSPISFPKLSQTFPLLLEPVVGGQRQVDKVAISTSPSSQRKSL